MNRSFSPHLSYETRNLCPQQLHMNSYLWVQKSSSSHHLSSAAFLLLRFRPLLVHTLCPAISRPYTVPLLPLFTASLVTPSLELRQPNTNQVSSRSRLPPETRLPASLQLRCQAINMIPHKIMPSLSTDPRLPPGVLRLPQSVPNCRTHSVLCMAMYRHHCRFRFTIAVYCPHLPSHHLHPRLHLRMLQLPQCLVHRPIPTHP